MGVSLFGAHAVILPDVANLVPDYLTREDLDDLVGAAKVRDLFDDDGDGQIQSASQDERRLNSCMARAEAFAAARMLRGFTKEQIVQLAQNDGEFRYQVAWVALEFATERRGEFLESTGQGRYWAQYERAVEYFDRLSKSQLGSVGEAVAGKNKNAGGAVYPKKTDGSPPTFIFAPDPEAPEGRGGF